VEPVRVARDLAEEEIANADDDARALLEPVERVQRGVPSCWRRADFLLAISGAAAIAEPGLGAVDAGWGRRSDRCGSWRSPVPSTRDAVAAVEDQVAVTDEE
jgi:hypothetical protein